MTSLEDWRQPNLVSYWDQRTDATARFRERLLSLRSEDRIAALEVVRKTVNDAAQSCPDKNLRKLVFVVGDDLYKSANVDGIWDEALSLYLKASAGEFFGVVQARGYRMHYIVDNAFSDLTRPLNFDAWFRPCGIVYICPQFLASKMMERDKVEPARFHENLPRYIDEGRYMADEAVKRCVDEQRHFLFLDADSKEGSFTAAQAASEHAGVITVLRNEAPLPGSKVDVRFSDKPAKGPQRKRQKKG